MKYRKKDIKDINLREFKDSRKSRSSADIKDTG